MDTIFVSRSYLETLSTADLLSLCDEYGLDVPENLNRRFIIGELLEAVDEVNDKKDDNMQESDYIPDGMELPVKYNETVITAVLRNPAWCYVYWDIKDSDLEMIEKTPSFQTLALKVLFLRSRYDEKPVDSFDLSLSFSDRDQYVLLPSSESFVRIDLFAEFRNLAPKCLAKSEIIKIPKGCPDVGNAVVDNDISPILTLSGFNELMRTHYINHRQSFS